MARNRGFTLLEIVVAVAILGISVGTAMQIFSGGLKNIRKMDLAHQAMNHAENVMSRILSDETVRGPVHLAGELDQEFRYEAVVDYWEETMDKPSIDIVKMNVHLLRVRVDVHFKNDRQGKLYRATSLKMFSDQPLSGAPARPMDAIRQLFGNVQ